MKRYYLAAFTLIVLFAISPFFSLMLSSFIAGRAGCALDEAEPHPCMINGHDYGEKLYELGMSFWYMIFTIPLAEAAAIIWAMTFVIHLVLRWRRRRRDSKLA